MFDVGLSELMVIAVVALIVIGPERLPKVARTAGLLLGRLQRYVSDVKADINREIQLDELKKMQQQVTAQMTTVEASVTHELREVETSLNQTVDPLAAAETPAPGAGGAVQAAGAATQAVPPVPGPAPVGKT